ncbi:hypothetical protein [Occallatibacter riparius]|uniref:Uncharacterized protein n=1 Tax=Occallatibacter riparius TaxID=1002689 RepID=A0A9J7BRR5_9BACT|nr:hypothetical protein [Occallatibacter riparius]UWZ85263.1 hypothetical protein MOP44_04810 [Occallatibacter riparius]
MTKVAEKFSVSGSYMARICTVLNVPRPERGYWAKLEVGKAPVRPKLPEAVPGDQTFWFQEGDPLRTRVHPALTASAPPVPRSHRIATGTHSLLQGAKQHYEKGHKIEGGHLLRPFKRQLVDVIASAAGLKRALAFANDLFNALGSAGHRVRFVPSSRLCHRPHIDEREDIPKVKNQNYAYNGRHLWRPSSLTVVYVGSLAFGLTVVEMTEAVLMRYVDGKYIRESEYRPPRNSRTAADHTWTTTKEVPSGRLRLVVYSPHPDVSWSLMFQETAARTLTEDITKIVRSMKSSSQLMLKAIQEAEHQADLREQEWKAQQERWRREEDQRQIAKSVKDSSEQLNHVIQAWAAAVAIEQFLKGVEERATMLSGTQLEAVQERLRLAREFVGAQNPLELFLSWKTPGERYVPLGARTS